MLLLISLVGGLAAVAVLQISVSRYLVQTTIKLPCRAEQTVLTVLELRSYDGPFLEDGSRRQVQGVAAVVLYNGGQQLLERGAVKLRQGEELLVFSFSMLPPGARLLVLENSGKRYSAQRLDACWGWSVEGKMDGRIRTEEAGRTALALTNVTQTPVNDAWVYYKDYDPSQRLLVGGISYSVHISNLKPGHRATLPAFGYLSGSSMIIQ